MSAIDEIRRRSSREAQDSSGREGIDPYPADSKREIRLADAASQFETLEKDGAAKWIAGRVMSVRGGRAASFS
ncbi:MAG: hypothetical protein WDN09_04350 [bacterium]